MIFLKYFVFVLCFLWTTSSWAIEVYFKNGDKISGSIVADDGIWLTMQTMAAGIIKINRAFIDLPKTFPEKYSSPKIITPPPAPPVQWKKDLSLGFTQIGGNTKSQDGQVSADLDRKTAANEFTMKYTADYTSSKGVMNGKKFYGLLRYAYSFGPYLKWYNFYKMEGNQDYFADIEYRLNPTVGVGYWFSENSDFKAMAELGIGYQYTSYRLNPGPEQGGEPVLVPRFFIDKHIIWNLHLTEDFTFYPSLEDFGSYHFRSETDLVNQITKQWAFKISYIDEFNSTPPPGVKKQDYTWVTALEYRF